MRDSRAALVRILRMAFSGERAAGYAYRGHWRASSDPEERRCIRRIEDDEWRHRAEVGALLQQLGARPSPLREVRAMLVGRALQLSCHVAGWFAPMYGAGRLERGNIVEYEIAARHAAACGHPEMVECLLAMAETEWDHEQYFRGRLVGHRLLRFLPLWPPPPPRSAIRSATAASSPARGAA